MTLGKNLDVISIISSGYGLEYETKEMEQTNVSEALKEIAPSWFKPERLNPSISSVPPAPILIHAPTGSGKSTFVLRDLARLLREQNGRILLLTNRVALCLQQRIIANEIGGRPRLGSYMLERCSVADNIDIITYQEVPSFFMQGGFGALGPVRAIVFDEAHFFCADSTFNSYTSTILRQVINWGIWCQRIYMTATPEDVKPIIAFEEKSFWDVYMQQYYWNHGGYPNIPVMVPPIPYKIKEYSFPFSYNHVDLHFCYSIDSIVQRIKSEKSEDKWLIFVRTKEDGESLKNKIGKSDAVFINADIKGDDKQIFRDLVRREFFDKKVLIATTVLYNGVNFKDDKLKNVVVETASKVELIQMLGRKRCKENEQVNLYVLVPEKADLEDYKRNANHLFDLTQQYMRDSHRFFRDKWNRGNIDEKTQKLFGIPTDLYGISFAMSDYAPYQLARESGDYEYFIDRFDREDSFQIEICQWLHKEYTHEMDFGETKEEMKCRVKKEVMECFNDYQKQVPLDVDKLEEFWCKLVDIIQPIKNEKELQIRYSLQNDTSKAEPNHNYLNADVNRILKFCYIPWESKKDNKKYKFVKAKLIFDV